jgi:hypothetical protein
VVLIVNWHDPEISQIQTREDLAQYLAQLAARVGRDEVLSGSSPVAEYIDAAGRWTGSMTGFFENILKEPVPDQPDWAMVAAIFTAAVVYE